MRDYFAFASHPTGRSAVLLAAVSFAAFHLLAMVTPPVSLQAELVHFGAVVLRFLVPACSVAVGVAVYISQAHRQSARFNRR